MMKTRSFNPVAEVYTKNVSPYRFTQFLTLVHELGLKGDEALLDIGCGAGVLTLEAARRLSPDGSVHGIDISPDMISLARRRAEQGQMTNAQFGIGDALNLDFEDNSFDIIMSSNAFPWVADRPRFLSEVYRVLKPTGRFGLVSLSDACYREFAGVFKSVAQEHPRLLPVANPLELAGGRLLTSNELETLVARSGLSLQKQFTFSTEEFISADQYFERVDSIVNKGYLDHLPDGAVREDARQKLYHALAAQNGSLKITESSLFVLATKAA